MDRIQERTREIDAAMADIRAIEQHEGATRSCLAKVRLRLIKLAARTDLFTVEDFPPPEPGGKRPSCLYRLSEDADHRYALYANSSLGGYATPAHNHTTWAVIVGICGEELNRFYDRTQENGVRENGQHVVRQGSGVSFMPDDLHSIHIAAPVLNFHMYGLALEQLHRREYYKPEENAWAIFPPHSDIREARAGRFGTKTISSAALRERLIAGGELALLDVREQGVHYRGHPFFACSLPLSRLELMAADLLPLRTVPVVLLDGGNEGLAERAAAKLASLGYGDIAILEGGCAGWTASGGELFSGVNVPSKAFGEFVEHHYDTPRVPPEEVKRLIDGGTKLVILDSRPYSEYHRMNIPGGIDAPGAELVYRVHDLAPDPDTLVVVNCAGRTRSIIGCQSLRNAGIPNKVVALKDGTMGWELAGYQCERGSTHAAPLPSAEGGARARAAAELVARKFKVKFATRTEVQAWQHDAGRTLFLLDVRSIDEFELRHIAGSRHAPGGQVVQATDEYIGVRNSRVVLIDPARVRSVMTASWLNQMGWNEVYVLEPGGEDGFAGWPTESGPRANAAAGFTPWRTIGAPQLAARQKQGGVIVLDLATSLHFRARHIPDAWWAVRARLDQARARLPEAPALVLTSEDGTLAHLAAPEASKFWPGAEVSVLDGGNAAWFEAKLPVEQGVDQATTSLDDVWYKPYDHAKDYEKHARAYLSWEVALVDQIKRDPTIKFRAYD